MRAPSRRRHIRSKSRRRRSRRPQPSRRRDSRKRPTRGKRSYRASFPHTLKVDVLQNHLEDIKDKDLKPIIKLYIEAWRRIHETIHFHDGIMKSIQEDNMEPHEVIGLHFPALLSVQELLKTHPRLAPWIIHRVQHLVKHSQIPGYNLREDYEFWKRIYVFNFNQFVTQLKGTKKRDIRNLAGHVNMAEPARMTSVAYPSARAFANLTGTMVPDAMSPHNSAKVTGDELWNMLWSSARDEIFKTLEQISPPQMDV